MLEIDVYEWIGYLGSVLVAWSITLQNLHRLRQMNLVGAAVFTLYGVLVEAWPVALVNGFIALVNIWHLSHWKKSEPNDLEEPDDLEVISFDVRHPFVQRFLNHYEEDILTVFPQFASISDLDFPEDIQCDFVYRNMVPSGLCIHRKVSPHEHEVSLTYVTPDHRNYQTFDFVYTDLRKRLSELEIHRLRVRETQVYSTQYLLKFGFTKWLNEDDGFVLEIGSPSQD